jgi:ethanolamine utilization protein EutQ
MGMKTLVSAETVRDAHARGQASLPAGKNVLITPEARGLAGQLGIRLDEGSNTLATSLATSLANSPATPFPAANESSLAAIRAAVLAKLPADAAGRPELVEQIVSRVCAAQKSSAAVAAIAAISPVVDRAATSAPTAPAVAGGIKLVKGDTVHLGVFPGAGADKQVGIADVITAADGAPIAAGFMAWSQCFFPWTLDYDEIDLVLEGELHIRCNGQTYVGKSGDVFYIPKGSAIEFGTTSAVRFFYVTYPANWQG